MKQQQAKVIKRKVTPAGLVALTVQQKLLSMVPTVKNPRTPCVWLTNFFPVLTFCKQVTPLGGAPRQNHI